MYEIDRSCESYILGKQHRNKFLATKYSREKELLELVHTNLCDHMQTQSLGGNFYLLKFINDYSRNT